MGLNICFEQVELLRGLAVQGHEAVGKVQQAGHLDRVEVQDGQEVALRKREGPAEDVVQAGRERIH